MLAALVVSLSVVPAMVVPASVVPDSTEVTVVGTVVVSVVVVDSGLVVLDPVEEVEAAEAIEEATLLRLLATEEASEAMLEARPLRDARADERAADTDEMRGAAPPLVVDWPSVSPEKRPRATRARV